MGTFFKNKRKTRSRRLSLLLMSVTMLFSVMVSATAFAEVQQVSLSPSSPTITAGSPVSLEVNYNVDTADNTLIGVGVRIHYNSTILTYTGSSNVFSTGIATDPDVPQADSGNEDGDDDTDMIILLGYSDPFGGNWPNATLPLKLADLAFNEVGGTSTVTDVNVTFSSVAVGYTGLGTGAAITVTNIVCGDGVVGGTEACDDGATNGDTTCGCQSDCTYTAAATSCEDGLFCNGDETCDGSGTCQAGTSPVTDDGVGCTDDSCDETNDVVVNTANNSNCDNGLFCDGSETCDATQDCQAGSDPCPGDLCNDTLDTCVACVVDADCDNGAFCDGIETCDGASVCQAGTPPVTDDGVGCTDDFCDETNDVVVNAPNNSNCDNGTFCDGIETCDATQDCQAGTSPVTDDGVGCTDDSCDETNDVVVNAPNDSLCDNGSFCDGSETCDATQDCQAGSDPCPGDLCNDTLDICVACVVDADCDNGAFCDGSETCDGAGVCQAGTPPVTDDGVGCTDDSCDETNDVVVNAPNNSNCDNGTFCDGSETCDATQDCQAGTPPVTDDGVGCTDDSCDETNDVVVNAPNDSLCDNGSFCDGSETCDATQDCQAGSDPCPGDLCNDTLDICVACVVDADCDNGAFCDGSETCDGAGVCQAGTPPVTDDGVGCTDDSCDETNDVVVNAPNNSNCDNGTFCDGSETCDATQDCQAGTPPVTDDGVGCTDDSCDETNDVVVNAPNDSLCDNGAFCDGSETCDAVNDCQAGTSPVTDDGVGCTDDSCDEVNDVVVNTANNANCSDDGAFCNGDEFCDTVNDCTSTGDPCAASKVCDDTNDVCVACQVDGDCDDGAFCNGAETCNAGDCQSGTPPVVDDGVGCTDDSCDEGNDVVVNTANNANCSDDGAFCNGDEFCDALNDCTSTGDPCAANDICDDTNDVCGECLVDGNCDDGAFCNGAETCNAGVCQSGTPPEVDDDDSCTDDSCDEVNDVIVNTTNDTDTDNDTIPDCNDNCLNDANTDQADADNDDVGDACDVCPGFDDAIDTDNDGVPDGCDACPDSDADFDSDGIEDCADNAPCNSNQDQADKDGDGVGDAAEMGFDGNEDDIPDIDQKNVASLYVVPCQDYVTLSTAVGCSLVDLVNVPSEEVADLPIGVDFPFGLFEFTLEDCVLPGIPVTITLNLQAGTNLPGDFGVNTYYKFGPTLDNAAYHWYDFLYDDVSQTGVTFLDDAVTMEFIDGVKGDDNLVADGVIIDLGGPAFVDNTGGGGGGGGGGCFIDTLFPSFWKNK